MKTMHALLLAGSIAAAPAGAAVVSGTAIQFGGQDGEYSFSVAQMMGASEPQDFTDFIVAVFNGFLVGVDTTADMGSDWYAVNYGDEFSAATIAEGRFARLWPYAGGEFPMLELGAEPFYLGVNAETEGGPLGARNLFGWAQLHYVDGELTMLGNAMSYHSSNPPGIYVGTLQEVPLPPSLALLLSGTAVLGLGRRLRRS